MCPAGVLFNNVMGDLDFKLTRLVLKACWSFSNETDLTRTVDSQKLELSGDQKNTSSYREFEFLRNGLKTMKITGFLS